MVLTKNQNKTARAKIRNHYELDHSVTESEMWGELKSLQRKSAKQDMDDSDELLLSSLSSGSHAIDL